VLKTIDAPAAVVILVADSGELETATVGIDNDQAMFEVCYSVTMQIAAQIYADMPPDQQRKAAIVLPTREDAQRLGILRNVRT
jgi:hypothetical protein